MFTRTHKKTMASMILGSGLALGLGGCVSQQHYDQMEMQYRVASDRNSELARENEQLQSALSLQGNASSDTQSTLGQLRVENERLRGELADNASLFAELDDSLRGLQLMDPATDRALRDLARRFPDVVVYDSTLGMLRFASDLTFNSGSDQLREGAQQTLASLAEVLKGQEAARYQLHIVGHTDSQAISSGTAQRHPTNTHLSVHRAISVKSQLTSLGIPAERVLVAGWGEFKPAVSNSASGNTPQNRRVEIFFRADNGTASNASGSGTQGTSAADTTAAPTRAIDPTK
jgi:chemotaxis protein MotB